MKGDLGSSKLEMKEGTVADRGVAESLFECGEDLFFRVLVLGFALSGEMAVELMS